MSKRATLLLPLGLLLLLAAAAWQLLTSGDGRRVGGEPRGLPAAPVDSNAAALAEPTDAPLAVTAERAEIPTATDPADAAAAARAATRAALLATRRPLQLHVISATTGEELREVEVHLYHSATTRFSATLEASKANETLLARGDSPLQLPPPESSSPTTMREPSRLVIRAAGCATATLLVEWMAGGTHRIELQPGGSLDLELVGAPEDVTLRASLHDLRAIEAAAKTRAHSVSLANDPLAGRDLDTLQLEISRADARLASLGSTTPSRDRFIDLLARSPAIARCTVEVGHARFAGVAAGRYALNVAELGKPRSVGALIELELTAGEQRSVRLEWQPPEQPIARPIEGIVRFDRGWLDRDLVEALPERISVRSLDLRHVVFTASPLGREIALEPGPSPETRRFSGIELPPGGAAAWFATWNCYLLFDVPADDSRAVELVVPPPAELTVEALPLGDGRALPTLELGLLGYDDPRAALTIRFAPPRPLSREGSATFVVPACTVELECHSDDGSVSIGRTVRRLNAGAQTISLSLREPATAYVTLRDGDAIVPFQHSAVVTAIGRDGMRLSPWFTALDDTSATAGFDGEGPATLVVDALEGYLPSEPIAVELVRGQTTTVEVPLQRAQ